MMAMQAPPATTAFVAMLDPTRATPDALAIVDVEPASKTYDQMVGRVDMPNRADELHHYRSGCRAFSNTIQLEFHRDL